MPPAAKHLIWFLRTTAVMFLCAAPAVVMPKSMMDYFAELYGLDALPDVPLMGYLARHMSALYAMMGASYWYLSTDVPRYLPILRFSVPLSLALGITIVLIDLAVAMPPLWTAGEALSMFSWTAAFWCLVRRVQSGPRP
jgi:hypothetical protein